MKTLLESEIPVKKAQTKKGVMGVQWWEEGTKIPAGQDVFSLLCLFVCPAGQDGRKEEEEEEEEGEVNEGERLF